MAMGTSVLQIRIELIFRQCWNLITLGCRAGISVAANAMAVSGRHSEPATGTLTGRAP